MRLYMVEITTYAVVVAEDEGHAREVASDCRRDALRDDIDPQIEVGREVAKLQDLENGWDGECIPYGGDGNTHTAIRLFPYRAPIRTSCRWSICLEHRTIRTRHHAS